MPVEREQVRRNLVALVQSQVSRVCDYGALRLAVWYDIREQAEDVRQVEVFERFVGSGEHEHEDVRLPGMGELWLPGLYIVRMLSVAEFERQVAERSAMISRLTSELKAGLAEIVWPPGGGDLGIFLG